MGRSWSGRRINLLRNASFYQLLCSTDYYWLDVIYISLFFFFSLLSFAVLFFFFRFLLHKKVAWV
jgi:hypothetical protein